MTFLVYLLNPRVAMRKAAWCFKQADRVGRVDELERLAVICAIVMMLGIGLMQAALRVRG